MTSPRRRWLLLALWLPFVAVAFVIWLFLQPARGSFTMAQYERIQLGMTSAELERAVGYEPTIIRVPGLMIPGRLWNLVECSAIEDIHANMNGACTYSWSDSNTSIVALFTEGKVVWKGFAVREAAWRFRAGQALSGVRRWVGL
jgi:hypothetical protein